MHSLTLWWIAPAVVLTLLACGSEDGNGSGSTAQGTGGGAGSGGEMESGGAAGAAGMCGDPEAAEMYAACTEARDEATCTAAGGNWTTVGLARMEVCQCPTGQERCPCTRSSDCLSECVAPPNDGLFDCEGITEGLCSPGSITVGCRCWFDADGSVMGACAE